MAPYHQAAATGLQGAETDAEQHGCGESVVVDETPAVGLALATVQGQVCVGVAGKQHRTEVDLQGDGLNSAVHADVTLRWTER